MTNNSLTPLEQENERIAHGIPKEVFGDSDLLEDLYARDAVDHNPFGSQRVYW